MCQIHTFPRIFQYFCRSSPIELPKKIYIIFFPSDVTLDRFGTTLAAEPTPKTPPKSRFLNVRKTHFSNVFSMFLEVVPHRFTDHFLHHLRGHLGPSWGQLGPSWRHLGLQKLPKILPTSLQDACQDELQHSSKLRSNLEAFGDQKTL